MRNIIFEGINESSYPGIFQVTWCPRRRTASTCHVTLVSRAVYLKM
ncbi:unnamed protein product [Nippostrongylus brasiliensis]|uniref:Uncharacterized protein n=1 Tax=Nippostrongylus brasiliensis TaxID=27835 RepID=A0A0N4YZB0_NIPBR|nr:unnamed protein product [Nippostrongylus brasiliensis]